MAKKMYRGGVFGFGGMGQEFTDAINYKDWYGDEFKVIGACNRGEEKRKLAEERYNLKAFEDPRDLIKEGIDFGLVTSTTVAHCEQVQLLAEAGIPIFCEKPIALTLEEGRQMMEAVEKVGVKTVVNFAFRIEPANIKVKNMIDNGELGQLLACSSFHNRAYGFYKNGRRHRAVVEPEESGGWTVHHACHQIDLLCWWMGEVATVSELSISTVEGIESDRGLLSEEIIFGRLQFKNSAIGSVIDSVGGVRDSHISVTGSDCGVGFAMAGKSQVLRCKYATDNEYDPPHIIDPAREIKRVDNLHHFLKIINGQESFSRVTIADAYYSLKVSFALKESAKKNGEVIKVDDIG